MGDKPVSLSWPSWKADFTNSSKPELETLDTWLDRALETSAEHRRQRRALGWPNASRTKPRRASAHGGCLCQLWSLSVGQFSSINQEYRTRQLGVQVNIDFLWRLHQRGHHASHRQPRARARNELEATVKNHIGHQAVFRHGVSLAKVQALELVKSTSERRIHQMGFKAGMRAAMWTSQRRRTAVYLRRDLARPSMSTCSGRLRLKARRPTIGSGHGQKWTAILAPKSRCAKNWCRHAISARRLMPQNGV